MRAHRIDPKDRQLVERLFLEGGLMVLFTTTTLAVGVNLPAHLVIVKNTKRYVDSSVGYAEYDRASVLQMIGRAGRPQFDDSGTAVILTEDSMTSYYRNLSLGNETIESQLAKDLFEHINSEIAMHTINSTNEALIWLRTTYLYTRMALVPNKYGKRADETLEKFFNRFCQKHVKELVSVSLFRTQLKK